MKIPDERRARTGPVSARAVQEECPKKASPPFAEPDSAETSPRALRCFFGDVSSHVTWQRQPWGPASSPCSPPF